MRRGSTVKDLEGPRKLVRLVNLTRAFLGSVRRQVERVALQTESSPGVTAGGGCFVPGVYTWSQTSSSPPKVFVVPLLREPGTHGGIKRCRGGNSKLPLDAYRHVATFTQKAIIT